MKLKDMLINTEIPRLNLSFIRILISLIS